MNTETDTIDSHFTLCEAAPDLLAALERIVAFYKRHGGDDMPMIEQADAAIAKANGGAK